MYFKVRCYHKQHKPYKVVHNRKLDLRVGSAVAGVSTGQCGGLVTGAMSTALFNPWLPPKVIAAVNINGSNQLSCNPAKNTVAEDKRLNPQREKIRVPFPEEDKVAVSHGVLKLDLGGGGALSAGLGWLACPMAFSPLLFFA